MAALSFSHNRECNSTLSQHRRFNNGETHFAIWYWGGGGRRREDWNLNSVGKHERMIIVGWNGPQVCDLPPAPEHYAFSGRTWKTHVLRALHNLDGNINAFHIIAALYYVLLSKLINIFIKIDEVSSIKLST